MAKDDKLAEIAAQLTIAATQNIALPDSVHSDTRLLAETIVRTYKAILDRLKKESL